MKKKAEIEMSCMENNSLNRIGMSMSNGYKEEVSNEDVMVFLCENKVWGRPENEEEM